MKLGVLPFVGKWLDKRTISYLAQRVEELGYDSLWAADHTVIPVQVDSRFPYNRRGRSPYPSDIPWWEPITTLAYAAALTQRVILGIGVLVLPHRNPVLNAKMLGQVQILSGGRLVVGVGVGWMEEEALVLGSPWKDRGPRTDEHMQLMRALWQSDFPTFQGRYYSVQGVGFGPRPDVPPPLWVGGHTMPALRRAAILGDGWVAYALPPQEVAEKWKLVKEMASWAHRDPASLTLAVITPLAFTQDDVEDLRPLRGSPRQVAAMVQQYEELGVDHLVVAPPTWISEDAAIQALENFYRVCRQ